MFKKINYKYLNFFLNPNIYMSSRYDVYKVLFTNDASDDRPNLYLGMIADYLRVGSGKPFARNVNTFDLQKTPQVKNQYYQTDSIKGLDDDAVHPQWMGFVISVTAARNKASSAFATAAKEASGSNAAAIDKTTSEKILAVIKSLATVTTGSGTFEEAMIQVVKHLMADIKDSGGISLKSSHSQWGNATTFTFEDSLHKKLSANLGSSSVTLADVLNINDAINRNSKILATELAGSGAFKDTLTNVGALLDVLNGKPDVILPKHIHTWTSPFTTVKTSDHYDGTSGGKKWGDLNSHVNTDAGGTPVAGVITMVNELFGSKLANLKNRKFFGYKWTLYLVKMLLKEAASELKPTDLDNLFPKDESAGDLPKYYRNAAGELLEIKNGKAVNVESQAEYLEAMNKKCHTTAVNDTSNGKTCTDYFKDCLIGQDIEQCKSYLKDKKFWSGMEKEVREMHPTMAHKTLKAFGFKGVHREIKNRSGVKVKLIFISSYEDWIQSLKLNTKINPSELTDITQNTKLEAYLRALIKLVNENPGIINKDYVQDPQNPLQQTSSTTLATKYGLKMNNSNQTTLSDSERLRNLQLDNTSRMRLSLNPLLFLSPLVGGAPQQTNQWVIFDAQYKALVNQLKAKGKTILPKDDQSVKSLIDNLKHSEIKLHKIMAMTSKYNQLLSAYGEIDGTNSPLTLVHLKEFVDKRAAYFEKVASKQRNLISVIQAVSEAAVSQALSNNAQSTTSQKFVDI